MTESTQLILLIILILALYIISSRWRPEDEAQTSTRIAYRVGLVVALLIVIVIAVLRSRHGT